MPAPRRSLLVISLAVAALTADLTIVTVASHALSTDLKVGLSGLQWVVGGYAITFASLLLPAGAVADRVGRRSVFTTGVAVFTAASLVCGIAPNEATLIAGRVAQGLGGALVNSCALALIVDAYREEGPRRRAIAAYSAVSAVAAAAAPLAGGWLIQEFGWRSIFAINIPIGLFVIAASRALPTVRVDRRRPLDVPEAAAVSVGLVALNLVLTLGQRGWAQPAVWVSAAVGLAAAAVALARRRAGRDSVFAPDLLAIRSFRGVLMVSVTARITSLGLLVYFALYLEGVLGCSPLRAGLRLLPFPLLFAAVSVLAPVAQRVASARLLVATGLALSAAGLAWSSMVNASSGWTVLLPALVLLGVGGGLLFPPMFGLAVGPVPEARRGLASGLVNASLPLGTALGVAVLGLLESASIAATLPAGTPASVRLAVTAAQAPELRVLDSPLRAAYVSGLRVALVAAAVVAALGVVAALVTLAERHDVQRRS